MRPLFVLLSLLFIIQVSAQEKTAETIAFERFVKAQNDHDLSAVSELLLASPHFLWITKGTAVWGKDSAVKKFANLYKGTWTLEPDLSNFILVNIDSHARQIFVPIDFTIGGPGEQPKKTRFLMNMVLVLAAGKWKVLSILPIPSAVQP